MGFPDYSAQEEIIRKIGDAELLYKAGKKILRFKKKIYGIEIMKDDYTLLTPYFNGDVLNIGLGMGNSIQTILSCASVDSVLCYEIEQDIIDIYIAEYGDNDKLTIICADAMETKPDGIFDVILYELPLETEQLFNGANDYIVWGQSHLKDGGYIILPDNVYTRRLILTYAQTFNINYLSRLRGRVNEQKWIVMIKNE